MISLSTHTTLTLALSAVLLGCGGGTPPPAADAGTDAAAGTTWYTTCGDPVCSGHRDPPMGVVKCTTQKEGDGCGKLDERCDPENMCNSYLVCATKDPKDQLGGCPRSRAKYKEEIAYLSPAQLAGYHEELQQIRLATYKYKKGDPRRHLGFIIEDQEPSACIDPERDMVDLYGYTSMAVASLQVQARQIEALKRELQELRGRLGKAGNRPHRTDNGAVSR